MKGCDRPGKHRQMVSTCALPLTKTGGPLLGLTGGPATEVRLSLGLWVVSENGCCVARDSLKLGEFSLFLCV